MQASDSFVLVSLSYITNTSCRVMPYTRYEGSKLERARDMFEQCLAKCPSQIAPEFYIKVSTAVGWWWGRVVCGLVMWWGGCRQAGRVHLFTYPLHPGLLCNSTRSWRRTLGWPATPWPSTTGT